MNGWIYIPCPRKLPSAIVHQSSPRRLSIGRGSFHIGCETRNVRIRPDRRKKEEKKEKGGKRKEYSRWDSKQKRIILLQRLGVVNDGILGSLTRCVHLGQDFLRESLGNLVDVDLSACCSDAFGFGLGESGDVAVHGVLFVGDEEVSC